MIKKKIGFLGLFLFIFPFMCIYENGADDVVKWNLYVFRSAINILYYGYVI